MIVGESIRANSYCFSLLSPNTGSYVIFDPLNSEIGPSGSIIIKNYDEEDSYVSGTFSFKVPSGSLSESFSQSFLSFDYNKLLESIEN